MIEIVNTPDGEEPKVVVPEADVPVDIAAAIESFSVTLMLTAKQRQFLWSILVDLYYQMVGYGGARGGGKTFVSALAMILRRLTIPRSVGLMLRRTQGAADENLGKEIEYVLSLLKLPFGPGQPIHYKVQEKEWHFPNGSYINLGYCKTETDWQRYQGIEYLDIAFEEGTQFKETAFLDILASNRHGKGETSAVGKVWVTCNPGGVGHGWVKRLFIDADTRDAKTLWIKATLRDNKAMLMHDPGYRDRTLAKQPEWKRKRWEDGDWDSVEGQYFVFDPEKVIKEVEVPYWAESYAGVDAGFYPSAFAVVWLHKWKGTDGKPHVHISHELKRHRLNVYDQAMEALAIERMGLKNHHIKCRYADPQAWQRTEAAGGATASTSYGWAQKGMVVVPAYSKARAAGWMVLRTLFDECVITIDPRCHALLDELQNARHGEKTDDIHSDCDDHLLDALRYALVSVFGTSFAARKEDDPYRKLAQKKDRRIVVVRS